MMNAEVRDEFDEGEETEKCWTYIAANWRDEWLKCIRKDWQNFLRDTRAARRKGEATVCPNPSCKMTVPHTAVWYNYSMPPCCGFCDRYIQPYPANPRNRDLFNRFIAPELKRRGIANPFA